MAPYYGLNNTNKKPTITNLLNCQKNFFNTNSDGTFNLGKEAIKACKSSVYSNNSGLIEINPISTGNSERGCCRLSRVRIR